LAAHQVDAVTMSLADLRERLTTIRAFARGAAPVA